MQFSQRTEWPSEANPLSLELAVQKREKAEIFDFTDSNPTRCGFHFYNKTLLEPFGRETNLVYQPEARGLVSARQAVAGYYSRRGLSIQPDQIFITASTSEAYSFIFRLVTQPGGIIAAPRPGYPLLDDLIKLHDLQIERYPLNPAQNWQADFASFYGEREFEPQAVLVVNPGNPAGNFLTEKELAELCMLSKSRGAALISDEVFFDFTPSGETAGRVSAASQASGLTFTLSGISKTLGLPQMKLSWIVVTGPEEIRREACRRLEIISDTFLSAGTPAQNALESWFAQESAIQAEINARLRANLAAARKILAGIGHVKLHEPAGGWSAVVEIHSDKTDEEWALQLLRKDRVLVHPGYLFDFERDGFLVLSLLIPEAPFKEGLSRLAARLTKP